MTYIYEWYISIYNTQMHAHKYFSSSDGNSVKADVTSLSNFNYNFLLLYSTLPTTTPCL